AHIPGRGARTARAPAADDPRGELLSTAANGLTPTQRPCGALHIPDEISRAPPSASLREGSPAEPDATAIPRLSLRCPSTYDESPQAMGPAFWGTVRNHEEVPGKRHRWRRDGCRHVWRRVCR